MQSVVVGEHEYVDDDTCIADAFHVGCHARPDSYVAAVKVLTGCELEVHAWHANDEQADEKWYEKRPTSVLIANGWESNQQQK